MSAWCLAGRTGRPGRCADPPPARDYGARDFKRHLKIASGPAIVTLLPYTMPRLHERVSRKDRCSKPVGTRAASIVDRPRALERPVFTAEDRLGERDFVAADGVDVLGQQRR
jgi:hypothetical protein